MRADDSPAPSASPTHPPPPPDESPFRERAAAAGARGARLARLGDRIAELSARIQAATHELLVLIREFDEQEGWDGCLSCAQWLSWRAGLSPGAAREHVRVARALGNLPRLSDAMGRGKVSYSKVRAVTRVATAENEQTLLDVALAGTAAHVERIARAWRRIDRNVEQAEERRRNASRELRTWVDEDGMVVVRGRLTPDVGAVLRRALEAACDQARRAPASDRGGEEEAAAASAGAEKEAAGALAGVEEEAAAASADAEEPTLAQRQADAIGTVAEAALAGGLDRGTAGDRYQVVLHVDTEALAEPRDLPAGTSGGAASGSERRAGSDRVPAGTSGGAASGSERRAGSDRVPAGTSGGTASGSERRAGAGRVPAGTSGGAASGSARRAGSDRVPAGTSANAVSGSERRAGAGRVPAGTSGGAASGSARRAGSDGVPAGTSGGAVSGSEPRAGAGRVPAGMSGGAASGSERRAGSDRVLAGTPAVARVADGPGGGFPMRTAMPGRAGRLGQRRWPRTSDPCPGARPRIRASDAAASEPATAASESTRSAARAGSTRPARCAHRPATSASIPPAAPAGGSQTVLDEAGGIHVSAETARRVACDAATVTLRHGPGGEILDVGRRTRTISPALRRALAARDRQCRFPGCGNLRVDAHHVEHWADGGRTALDNLVLLCRRHHRAVHEEGFRVTVDAAGGVGFLRPDGRPLLEAPPAPAWTGPALQPTNDGLAAAGIEIDADTATPSWRGERLDLDFAMSVLWRPRREPPTE